MKKQLLLLAMMLPPFLASADSTEIDGIYYNLETKTKQAEVAPNPNKYTGNVVIPEKVTYESVEYSVTSIGGSAFWECSSLTSVTIGNSVTSIGGAAFYGCSGLTSVTIPNSVTSIGSGAFDGCSALTSITIPNSVTSIGDRAFYKTSWYNNQPDGLIYAGKVAYKYKGTMPPKTSISIKDGTLGIGEGAFISCSGLTSVTIPNSMITIGGAAFMYCSGLTSVAIPNGVTKIGGSTFSGCSGLTSITIPNSVTDIGGSAFYNCSGLTSIIIPNSVTNIGDKAFSYCYGLQSVYSKIEDVFTINENIFNANTYTKAKLYVPIGKMAAYQGTEGWNKFVSIEEYDYPTGIAAQQMGKDVKVVDAYQLNGQKLNDVQRGMNIVRMSNGTTKKVVVK